MTIIQAVMAVATTPSTGADASGYTSSMLDEELTTTGSFRQVGLLRSRFYGKSMWQTELGGSFYDVREIFRCGNNSSFGETHREMRESSFTSAIH